MLKIKVSGQRSRSEVKGQGQRSEVRGQRSRSEVKGQRSKVKVMNRPTSVMAEAYISTVWRRGSLDQFAVIIFSFKKYIRICLYSRDNSVGKRILCSLIGVKI